MNLFLAKHLWPHMVYLAEVIESRFTANFK